jgi:hypothetical protein
MTNTDGNEDSASCIRPYWRDAAMAMRVRHCSLSLAAIFVTPERLARALENAATATR